jgi:NAD(P)-dependent dehydrogenase (short-subunit alcohol dehydrogenase family)
MLHKTLLPKTPSFGLQGKRALVTGAGRGIGLAAASALAEAGAHVTLCARTNYEIAAAAAAIRDSGGRAEGRVLDVTRLEDVDTFIAGSDPFDILVNNAGTNRPAPFVEVTSTDFDLILDINVRAAFFMSQAVARRLIATGRPGSIIQISSQMGHVGSPRRSVYCASKHALEGMTKAMALELAPHNIRVNSLAPTFVETPMTKRFFENPEFRSFVLGKIKLGRIGHVEDLMGAIVFLASDAALMMTGTSLVIDGGWTAE